MHQDYNNERAGIGPEERRALEALSHKGMTVIKANDLCSELGYGKAASNLMLSRLYKKGWIQRLQPGTYRIIPLGSETTNPIPEDSWVIATELFSPCYLSGWTAAEHWELTEQIFNSTVVFTTQKLRKKEHIIAGLKYRTKLIENKNIFGTKKIWSNNTQISIADIHRTIIDILDDPEIGGGGRHTLDIVKEYFQNKEASPDILYQYAKQLGHGAVFKRLGFMADKFAHFPSNLREDLLSNIKTGVINLDPHGPKTGPIVSKWGIRINIPLGDVT